MAMKSLFNKTITAVVIASMVVLTSCIKDLDTIPIDPNVVTSGTVYKNYDNYKLVLAKCYGGLVLTGQQGPSGNADLSGLDEGFSQYMRELFYVQELTTDEAVIGWNDGSLRDYQEMDWSSANEFIAVMYARIFYQITLCNEFIAQTTESKVNGYGFTADQKAEIAKYRLEARFLRALSYYHAIDMFGKVPFVTEKDGVGSYLPKQISRPELFTYIETELKDIEGSLAAPGTNEYGRVDQAAAWMLLARLYLNSDVYGGGNHYNDVVTYVNKVISSNVYTLADTYTQMFMADNDQNYKSKGIIFAIPHDGKNIQTWGGTTFLIHASMVGTMNVADYGITSAWSGLRIKPSLVALFPDPADKRGQPLFYTSGQTLDITDMFTATNGYGSKKWSNMKSTGVAGSDPTYTDTDWPLFRLADAYLMYAEAYVRGATSATQANAVNYVDLVREKAYGGATGDIQPSDLTLSFILAERGREFWWEGYRRTDLIRFGLFTGGTYLWQWKGGTFAGTATDSRFNVLPIPDADRSANPNLRQNDGY
jgi:starch-binding outer membrane protein, SusD/RagB family